MAQVPSYAIFNLLDNQNANESRKYTMLWKTIYKSWIGKQNNITVNTNVYDLSLKFSKTERRLIDNSSH